MPAGFQSWTDGNIAQITDVDIFFTLAIKGTTAGVTWVQEGNNSGYYDLVISGYSLSDAPMLALKGPGSWHTLIAATGSSLTFRIFRVGSGDITYYFFTNRRPAVNASKSGLEVYNSAGQIVYASDTLIARPMGVFSGALFGSSSYAGQSISGRDIAHVPIKQGTYSFQNDDFGGLGSCTAPGGISGYSLTRTTGFQRSAIAASTGSIASAPRASQVTLANIFCSTSFSPDVSSSASALSYESLVLDVTHF
jgi:hypothetical protein